MLNGITSLLAWNTVLSSFDYYSYVYKSYNVVLWFPTPLFFAYMVAGILYNWVSKKKSYRFLISIGISMTNACIALLFIVSLIIEDKDLGFGISLFLCFLIGLSANSAQLSFFAMINYLG